MDFVSRNIAVNLKRLRRARRLTLDDVAEQTGVSKSMLGQIERGDSNPTIGTVSKIVSGLRISFNSLISTPRFETYVVSKDELVPVREMSGQFRIYNFFPYETDRKFDVYSIEVQEGGAYRSGSHGEDTFEYLVVIQGELVLKIGEEVHMASAGDAVRFSSDRNHDYINGGKGVLRITSFFTFGSNE